MSATHVAKQIEQILDQAPGDQVSVIVQMETSDKVEEYLQATTEAIDVRRAVTSARALLPPAKSQLKVGTTGTMTPTVKKKLQQSDPLSSMLFLASEVIRPLAGEALKKLGAEALNPVLNSAWIAARAAASKKSRQIRRPIPFPLSGSAALDLSKEELKALPNNVERIADVYPNRMVKIPPVAKSVGLPRVVEDNKANTWGLAKTGALAAWGVFDAQGEGATVAILDTGVDAGHPDLKGKIVGFAEFDESGQLVTDKLA